MNNSVGGHPQKAGAVELGGFVPAPAQFQVGAVGFGPWLDDDDEVRLTTKGYRQVCDGMAASIVRLEQENEELRAEVALLREEQTILQKQFAAVIEGSLDTSGDSDLSRRTNFKNCGAYRRDKE